MVAHLLKLKLLLLRNSFKRSPWQLVGVIIGGLYGLGIIAMLGVGLFFLGTREPNEIAMYLVLAVSLITLGWTVIPLVAFGVDLTLDPARFTTFTLSRPKLATGLLFSGFIGIPGVLTLLLLLGQTLAWRSNIAAMVAAVICGLLSALMCLALARWSTTSMTSMTGSRKFKDVAGIIAIIPLILLGPIITTSIGGFESALEWLPKVATVLGWTPLGAFAAVPADIASGALLIGVARFVLGLGYLGLVVWAWERGLHKAMENPMAPKTSSKAVGMGMFNIFPSTPTGAVAARTMTYWLKDPRYAASMVMVPLLPVIIYFASVNTGSTMIMMWLGPMLAILMAFSISADISYDSTAFSLHVLTGVSGVADRTGRVIACGLIALPVTLLATILPPVFLDQMYMLPLLLGISLCALLGGLGVSSVASARFTYSVPLPGESPFKTPPGAGARMAVTQLATFGIMFVLLIPVVGLAIAQIVTGNELFGWLALGVGIVLGSIFLLIGIRLGGRWMENRMPELMQAVMVNK